MSRKNIIIILMYLYYLEFILQILQIDVHITYIQVDVRSYNWPLEAQTTQLLTYKLEEMVLPTSR